jgi:hypothetical protein
MALRKLGPLLALALTCGCNEASVGSACVKDSPCTQANLDLGWNIFRASSSPNNYIQCVSVSQCLELSCNPGTVYNPIFRFCG